MDFGPLLIQSNHLMHSSDFDHWFPFPLDESSPEMVFGIQVLKQCEPLLVATESQARELQIKKAQAAESLGDYFQACTDSQTAQLLAVRYLRAKHPELSCVADDQPALLSLALQIQEDLVILEGTSPHRLIAGAVFFPSGWSIADKIGQSLQETHSVVPRFEHTLQRQTDRLVTHLKLDRPVWRMNWGVRPSDQLDQSPKWSTMIAESAKQVDATNAGTSCFFRVERQTLSRLPDSGAILFTIHTRQWPLVALDKKQFKHLYQTLRNCPDETLIYKGIAAFHDPLIRFLEKML
ncbi:MAG TPA: hypothetical protein DDZ51_30865 [Planctomycetaceae bacterium]|nr:hypothetical protein [Planctomycetaceae bacterium]